MINETIRPESDRRLKRFITLITDLSLTALWGEGAKQ